MLIVYIIILLFFYVFRKAAIFLFVIEKKKLSGPLQRPPLSGPATKKTASQYREIGGYVHKGEGVKKLPASITTACFFSRRSSVFSPLCTPLKTILELYKCIQPSVHSAHRSKLF